MNNYVSGIGNSPTYMDQKLGLANEGLPRSWSLSQQVHEEHPGSHRRGADKGADNCTSEMEVWHLYIIGGSHSEAQAEVAGSHGQDER